MWLERLRAAESGSSTDMNIATPVYRYVGDSQVCGISFGSLADQFVNKERMPSPSTYAEIMGTTSDAQLT